MIRVSVGLETANRRPEKGSAMVEFAVVVVLLLILLFGIVDFGRALYTFHFLSNAARDATRWASVNGATCGTSCDGTPPMNNGPATQADVQNYVRGTAPPGIDAVHVNVVTCGTEGGTECSAGMPVPVSCATTVNDPGCTVGVTVSYPFNFIVPLVHSGSITLSSTSQTIISH
jgi:Flp pilus assembly protein TadG